jgi:hypothetical protein
MIDGDTGRDDDLHDTISVFVEGIDHRPTCVSTIAYWPHFWKSAQLQQSADTFSGSQKCGTIENPSLTKNRGSCVKAQSVL